MKKESYTKRMYQRYSNQLVRINMKEYLFKKNVILYTDDNEIWNNNLIVL